jgi:phage antirepressor YoqD-like protein
MVYRNNGNIVLVTENSMFRKTIVDRNGSFSVKKVAKPTKAEQEKWNNWMEQNMRLLRSADKQQRNTAPVTLLQKFMQFA